MLSARELALDVGESVADGAVDDLVSDLDLDAADQVGLDDDVEVHRATGLGGQYLLEPLTVPGGQRCGDPDDGNAPPTARRRQLAHVVQRRLEGAPAASEHNVLDHLKRLGRDPLGEERADQPSPRVHGSRLVEQRGPQGRFGPHDLTETEQLVLDVVEDAALVGGRQECDHAELLDRRRERAPPVPPVARSGSHQVDGGGIGPAAQQGPGEGLAVIR